jgi:hypothetical protein
VARWGGATDPHGNEIDDASMIATHEDLLVTIAQDELEAFTNGLDELRRQGIAIQWVSTQELVRGDSIQIVMSLELVGDPSVP